MSTRGGGDRESLTRRCSHGRRTSGEPRCPNTGHRGERPGDLAGEGPGLASRGGAHSHAIGQTQRRPYQRNLSDLGAGRDCSAGTGVPGRCPPSAHAWAVQTRGASQYVGWQQGTATDSLFCPVPTALAGGALPHEATPPSASRPPLRPGGGDRGHRSGEWRSRCGLRRQQPGTPTPQRDGGVQRSPGPGLYPLQLAVPSGVSGRHCVLVGISLILIVPVQQRSCQCTLHLQLQQLFDPGRG